MAFGDFPGGDYAMVIYDRHANDPSPGGRGRQIFINLKHFVHEYRVLHVDARKCWQD